MKNFGKLLNVVIGEIIDGLGGLNALVEGSKSISESVTPYDGTGENVFTATNIFVSNRDPSLNGHAHTAFS